MLVKKPIITKAVSGVILFGLGDYMCQQMELKVLKKPGKIEYVRIFKTAAFGIVVAPYLHLQFCKIIPWLFPKDNFKSKVLSTLYAISISDGLFNLSFFIFMAFSNKTKEEKKSDLVNDIKNKFIPVQINSMKVWSVLTGINISFVPVPYRVLYDNFFCIFWNMYLSYVEYNTK